MTGIERLRELANGIDCSVWACTDRYYCDAHGLTGDEDGGRMRDALADIADQIEREAEAPFSRMLVMAVINEMEHYASSRAHGDDLPASSWARRLREMLSAASDPADDVSMSAYDLLPEDEREAIAWVREHGGLDAVKTHWKRISYYADPVPRSYAEKRIAKRQRQIDESHAALRRRNARIAELERQRNDAVSAQLASDAALYDLRREVRDVCEAHGIEPPECDLRSLDEAMNRRLMPEGMEWLLEVWPKWSNGEYCKFGDWWTADKYGDYEPKQLRRLVFYTPEQLREWEQDEGDNFGYEWDFMRPSDTTYRPDKAEPPVPKVLDADGVEIRVGDTVCGTRDMEPMRVVDTDYRECGFKRIKCEKEGEGFFFYYADELTHKLPILAADGKPLEVGQTVWDVESGTEYEVVGIHADEDSPVRVMRTDGSHLAKAAKPSTLTHERPDSWERLEEDALNFVEDNAGMPHDQDQMERDILDLVRRAKALAGDA